MLLVASETGHVYTFATEKLKPIIDRTEGQDLIEACLNNDMQTRVTNKRSSETSSKSNLSKKVYQFKRIFNKFKIPFT